MFRQLNTKEKNLILRSISTCLVCVLSFALIFSPAAVQAQAITSPSVLNLPLPGAMVPLSDSFTPTIVRGISIYPDNPLRFDFIMDPGDGNINGDTLKEESMKMIKYFLASMTVPEDQIWVNLSPYEKDQIITDIFGDTEMGRDLLAQDYLLKQLSASLMYPENELGQKFWNRVHKKARQIYGAAEIPMNTFNKIWVVPEKARVYENGGTAFVLESRLKVLMEEDYLALNENKNISKYGLDSISDEDAKAASQITSDVIRNVLLPEIEKEINEGKTFANLRQVYHSMILATWYKVRLKDSLLGQVYADQGKTSGVDTDDKQIAQKIYNQYLEAFKKGVYDYVKEDYNAAINDTMPRKYFSGGMFGGSSFVKHVTSNIVTLNTATRGDKRILNLVENNPQYYVVTMDAVESTPRNLKTFTGDPSQESSQLRVYGAPVEFPTDNSTVIGGKVTIVNAAGQEMSFKGDSEIFDIMNKGNRIIGPNRVIFIFPDEDLHRIMPIIKSHPLIETNKLIPVLSAIPEMTSNNLIAALSALEPYEQANAASTVKTTFFTYAQAGLVCVGGGYGCSKGGDETSQSQPPTEQVKQDNTTQQQNQNIPIIPKEDDDEDTQPTIEEPLVKDDKKDNPNSDSELPIIVSDDPLPSVDDDPLPSVDVNNIDSLKAELLSPSTPQHRAVTIIRTLAEIAINEQLTDNTWITRQRDDWRLLTENEWYHIDGPITFFNTLGKVSFDPDPVIKHTAKTALRRFFYAAQLGKLSNSELEELLHDPDTEFHQGVSDSLAEYFIEYYRKKDPSTITPDQKDAMFTTSIMSSVSSYDAYALNRNITTAYGGGYGKTVALRYEITTPFNSKDHQIAFSANFSGGEQILIKFSESKNDAPFHTQTMPILPDEETIFTIDPPPGLIGYIVIEFGQMKTNGFQDPIEPLNSEKVFASNMSVSVLPTTEFVNIDTLIDQLPNLDAFKKLHNDYGVFAKKRILSHLKRDEFTATKEKLQDMFRLVSYLSASFSDLYDSFSIDDLGSKEVYFQGMLTSLNQATTNKVAMIAEKFSLGDPKDNEPYLLERDAISRAAIQILSERADVDWSAYGSLIKLKNQGVTTVNLVLPAEPPPIEDVNASSALTATTAVSTLIQSVKDDAGYGGINFNPQLLDLEIKRDDNGVPLPIAQQPIENMNIEGFIPVIINIAPAYNLPQLLGFAGMPFDPTSSSNELSFEPSLKAIEVKELFVTSS